MELWVIFSVTAAAFQTVRFMLQKLMRQGRVGTLGSTFARFAYSMPFAWLVAFGYIAFLGEAVPAIGGAFWGYAAIGGLAQILATALVVALFQQRNFAVGITLKKTEVIQTALLGFVVLGDAISPGGWAAIAMGLGGVLLLSQHPGGHADRPGGKAVGLGLASGMFFAVSAVGYRGATLDIATTDPVLRATVALLFVTSFQTLVTGLWLRLFEPGQLTAVWSMRKMGSWMGVASLGGSLAWFSAFALQNAALVFAVGQIELIFSLAASVLFFRESVTWREVVGMAILGLSILSLVLSG